MLISDMVGSTALRSRLGDTGADAVRRVHDELLGSSVTANGGRVLRWTGDGVKAEFATASSAVQAALDMQRGARRYSARRDAIAPFEMRIGIAVGEVTEEDGDVHGVAVIEAARLEPLAGNGEIYVTELVARLGSRRTAARFDLVGEQSLKGLDDPVVVMRAVDTRAELVDSALPQTLVLDHRFPMVGRSDAIRRALEQWEAARQGRSSTVFAYGPPGIGKSRLVAQIADRAHAEGALVLAGECDPDLTVPYQSIATALRGALDHDPELDRAAADGSGPLAALFPSRRSGRLDEVRAGERTDLFDGVVELLDRLAETRPVVLILEDLQWATEPTIHLLRDIVRRLASSRLLVLATVRDEVLDFGHPLTDLAVELHRSGNALRLDLGELTQGDIAEMIAARVPFAPDASVDELARRVGDESAGNAFFVCELLHHLSSTGDLQRLTTVGSVAQLPLPDSIRSVVEQRLGRLSQPAQELLTMASVVGASFDITLIATLLGRPIDAVLDAIDETEHARLVREVGLNRFAFAHAMVRSALLDRSSATRRAITHRRIAEALATTPGEHHDELAFHWMAAGDEHRSFDHLERAARRDLEALAFESSLDRFEAVLDHRLRVGPPDSIAIGQAWLGRGLAKRAIARTDYVDDIREAARIGRRLRDADLTADAAIASIWPGVFFIAVHRIEDDLVELCESALQLLPADDRRRVRILSNLSGHLAFSPDRARKRALIDEATVLAQAAAEPELIGEVLAAEFMAFWDPSTLARRTELAERLRAVSLDCSSTDLDFLGRFFSAVCAVERADIDEARRRLDGIGSAAEATRNRYFSFLAERLSISIDILTAQSGAQVAVDALAVRFADDHADTSGTWAIQTGGLSLQAGTFGAMADAIRTLIDESALGQNWMAGLGLSLLERGDREGAEAALEAFEESDLDYLWLSTMLAVGELVAGLPRLDRCEYLYDRLLPFRDQLGMVASGSLIIGLVGVTMGRLAIAMGRLDDAIELLTDGIERGDRSGSPFEATRARRFLADALSLRGLPDDADRIERLRAEAHELALRHGFGQEARLLASSR